MSPFFQELQLAARSLRRNPGFTLAALACLTLGIGATTAIFSVVNAVLLRPLPFAQPAQLARIYTEFPNFPNGGLRRFWASGPEFLELRRDLHSWLSIDAWRTSGVNLAGSSEPIRATAAVVSGTLLDSLGVPPLLGRQITAQDDLPGAPRVAVIGEALWIRAFGRDPAILQREIWIDGRKTIVIGIMSASFSFPPGEVEPPELWTPLQLDPARPGGRGGPNYSLLGRLKPGVTLQQARHEADQYVRATGAQAAPNTHRFHPSQHPLVFHGLQDEVTGAVRPALFVMLSAVAFVLLIACGNVANLLLARAEARQREIAVRRAMGASSLSLIRQFFAEGLMLSLGGAALGLLFAFAALRLILAAASSSLPRASEVGIDLTILAFSVALCLLTGLFFGLAPLAQSLPRALAETLKAAGGRTTATRHAHLLRQILITSQIALALVLLIGAGLMIGAFWRLQSVPAGFHPQGVLTLRLALPRELYREPADITTFWQNLQHNISALPGVSASSLVSGLPPIRPVNANDTKIEGFSPTPGGPLENIDYYNAAGLGYFETLGIPLLEGRFFNSSDGPSAPPVVIINQTFARIYFPGQSPLGKRVRPSDDGPWRTIAGVVADVRNAGLDRPAGTELYFPFTQSEGAFRSAYILVRTQGEPLSLVPSIRSIVRQLDPNLPLAAIRTMDDVLAEAQARPRFLAILIGVFSSIALLLAALGIYSVMAYSVAQRTGEFGIRMAMGAQSSDVLRLVLRQGLALALAGLAAGAAGAFTIQRLLRGAVFGVGPFEPLPFIFMSTLLLAVALLACLSPALRATRVDPLVALRYE
jgi:putative ABC transport system permease protein